MEAARQVTKELKVSQALVAAVEEAQKASHLAKVKTKELKRATEEQQRLERQSKFCEVATRGRKRKQPLDLALADAEHSELVQTEAEEKRKRLLKQLSQLTHQGKREDLHPVKRKYLTELIGVAAAAGRMRLGKTFWAEPSDETGVSLHNLKSLVTVEGRALTLAKLAKRPRGKGRCTTADWYSSCIPRNIAWATPTIFSRKTFDPNRRSASPDSRCTGETPAGSQEGYICI